MRRKSLFLSKNLYESKDILIEELERAAEKLGKERKDIVKIILFGSILTDRFGLGSDADILIVLNRSKFNRFFDRIPEFLDFFNKNVSLPVDIFPYTEDEIEKMIRDKNPFILRILREGRVIYPS